MTRPAACSGTAARVRSGTMPGMPSAQPISATFSLEQVATAANRAADDVLEAAQPSDDEPTRDVVNLVVNALLTYLTTPGANLPTVVAENYDEDLETVIGWISA